MSFRAYCTRTGVALATSLTLLSLAPTRAGAAPTEPLELDNSVQATNECASCHLFLNPALHQGEPNVSPQAYTGSLMSNSARDPVFWAGVAIAHQDAPGETQDCVRCHAPIAFLEGRGDAIAIDELQPQDLHGVSCDLCHRMIDDGETPAGNARYVLDDVAVNGSVPRRGPWTYGPGEDPQHPTSDDDAHLASARLCGTCHDVTTARERVDDRGVGLGVPFNEQRTYSEWLGSVYAQDGPDQRSCQDCHMPALADVAGCDGFNIAQSFHATGGRRHDLVGLNLPVIQLIQAVYGKSAGGTLDDPYFELTREVAELLREQSATLDAAFPDEVDLGVGIPALDVTVTNNTGHKLPTGYSEGRVMWLEITATYGDALVYSSGRWDEQAMTIEDDAQVRRYEAIAEDDGDGARLHLLRNNHWVVDSRIPPRGLTPDLETDPVGDRYALGPDNTWPHQDSASFSFPPAVVPDQGPDVAPELTLRARLLYLINTPEYVEFLAEENSTNAAGTELAALFDE
ncbi:MAG: hypothetical protein KC468_11195, partial [Myxococcales bacterium]|nr:hypothetical protein [Myxococcales bacterium]